MATSSGSGDDPTKSTPPLGDAPSSGTPSSSGENPSSSSGDASKGTLNRLGLQRSPYLLQHATNPVEWYPWGEEAFAAASEQNKLIFLSVGYSTCHWCHVMERESFEDRQVAELMNEHFINIKVDREERPDVDQVYMNFVVEMTGHGGWPMSVWLTPSLSPVYGGTYYPPTASYGRPSFAQVLRSIAKQWNDNQEKIAKSGQGIIAVMKKNSMLPQPSTPQDTGKEGALCLKQLAGRFEPEFGGFGGAPKFPQPSYLGFLFCHYLMNQGDEEAVAGVDMATHTLDMMARGGIRDHVCCGFARYSTDNRWHVPHFEKMLYDQAQLINAYLDAFLVTRRPHYAEVAKEIVAYVCRDLSHESGGFFSAEDADSLPLHDSKIKKEGAFCVWTQAEINDLLSDCPTLTEDISVADLFCFHYSVMKSGNVDPSLDHQGELSGQNVLMERGTLQETAEKFRLSEECVNEALSLARNELARARKARPPPHRDEKIITAWNGMMLSALSRCGVVFGDPSYLERARRNAHFVHQHLTEGGRLARVAYPAGEGDVTTGATRIEGFCADYAWTVRGLINLYEATLDQSYISRAVALQEMQDELFWDAENGAYFTSTCSSVPLRLKEDHDGAEPSANSVSCMNLLRLHRFTEREKFLSQCRAILAVFSNRLSVVPIALAEMVQAKGLLGQPQQQVILSGAEDDIRSLLSVVHNNPHPNRLLLVASSDPEAPLYQYQPKLSRYVPRATGAVAYVCNNFVCSLPIGLPDQLEKTLAQGLKVHSG